MSPSPKSDEKNTLAITRTASPDRNRQSQDAEGQLTAPSAQTFPEGSLWGWLTLAGATLAQFATFGYANAFGVYQGDNSLSLVQLYFNSKDFYVRQFLPKYAPSDIGWIGGAQIFLIFSTGIFTGRLFDRGYFYHMTVAGTLLAGFSLFMLSLCQENRFYQVFLSQGIGFGLASGLIYLPSLSVVSHYFKKQRPMAMGIVATGSALGATLHPIMVNNLIHSSLGFHNGVRASAGFDLGILIIATLCMRTRLPPSKTGKAIPIWEFLQDPPYVAVMCGAILVFCGLFFPVFYLQLDAINRGVDPTVAFYSIPILNAASVLGRSIPGFLAPKFGVFNLETFFTMAAGVVILTMIAVKDLAGTVVFAIFVGFFTGAAISLFAPMLSVLAKDVNEIGVRIGIVSMVCGILGLFASPIAGALLTSEFIWIRAILFAGITLFAGGCFYGLARILVAKRKGTWII